MVSETIAFTNFTSRGYSNSWSAGEVCAPPQLYTGVLQTLGLTRAQPTDKELTSSIHFKSFTIDKNKKAPEAEAADAEKIWRRVKESNP